MTASPSGRARRVAVLWLVCWAAISGTGAGVEQMIQPPSPRQEGIRWALLVAVDGYADERIPRGKGAVGASKAVADLLAQRYGFAPSRIIEVYDREATSARIGEELRRLDLQMARTDSLLVLLSLASLDLPKERTVFLVPYDGRLDASWTLIPVPQIATTLFDLPADPLLAVFEGCASRWRFAMRQARGDNVQNQGPRGPSGKNPSPGPAASREFLSTCPETVSTVRESQAALVLRWLQERTIPGERRDGLELQKALASSLWSVETTVYGRASGYGFVARAEHWGDLAVVTDRSRTIVERGEAIERMARLHAGGGHLADSAATVDALRQVTDSAAEPTDLQQRAALALGQIPTEQSAAVLTRLAVDDPSPELALTAVRGLGGLPAALAVPGLESALARELPVVQRSALRLLVSLRSREFLPKIVALLRASRDTQVRLACMDALQALGLEGVEAVPTLVALARDDTDPEVSAAALRVLTQSKTDGRSDIFRERLAGARSPAVRRAAAYALGDMLPSDAAVAALLGALSDGDPEVREAVIAVLGKAKVTQARDALIGAMKDKESSVRVAAAGALGRLGDPSAIPALRDALASKTADERRAAAVALGRIGAVESFSELVRIATSDESAPVRSAADAALEALLATTQLKGARVEPALADPSLGVRAAALRWLSRSKDPAWLSHFAAALRSDDEEVRAAALEGLTAIASVEAVRILAEEARRPEETRRDKAVRALAGIRSEPALQALLSLAGRSRGSETADPAVIEALGGYDDGSAIARAQAFLDARDPSQRLAAASALQRQALALHERHATQRGIDLGEQALKVRQEILGETHPDVATDLNNLGVMYLELDQVDSARERLTRALEIRRGTELPDPDLSTTLANLGVIAARRADYKQALDYYLQALDIRQYLLGKDSDEATSTLDSIADVYEKLGDSKQAASYRQQADANRKRRQAPAPAAAD
jgi:HEAT repeat protein